MQRKREVGMTNCLGPRLPHTDEVLGTRDFHH